MGKRLNYHFNMRGDVYFGRYNDGSGKRDAKGRLVLACVRCGTSKTRADAIMRALVAEADAVRAGSTTYAAAKTKRMAHTPIAEHIEWCASAMENRGGGKAHADLQKARLTRVSELAEIVVLSDVSLSAVERGIAEAKRADGLSDKTASHHWAGYRTFLNYLVKDGRMASNPMAGSRPQKVVTLKHKRRALTDEEVEALCVGAMSRRRHKGFSGFQRAFMYRVVLATGLRLREAVTLGSHPEWLRLEGKRPAIFLPATLTKDRLDTLQPLPAWMADHLRRWMAMREARGLIGVFDVTHGFRASTVIGFDLKAAGVKARTEAGIVDFHSLRHTAITRWANAPGSKLQNVMKLARHKDIKTTMGYVHTGDQEIQDFLDGMGK